MNRRSIVGVGLILGLCLFVLAGGAFTQDFIPGAEREITRDSAPPTCVNDLHSPACEFERRLYCLIRPDQQICTKADVLSKADCFQDRITKIRYAIEQIYGIDDIRTWAPTLVPLTDAHQHARVVYRLKICLRDAPCERPVAVDLGDATKRNGTWETRIRIFQQVCHPENT